MKERRRIKSVLFLNLIILLLMVPSTQARSRSQSIFEYVAGTESLPKGCKGKLEVTQTTLVFESPEGSITVPYAAITRMEYGERVSKKIRKMELSWAIKPSSSRSKHEGYFTVLYSGKNQTRAMILKVSPDTMRPYLAEIDLRSGLPIHDSEN